MKILFISEYFPPKVMGGGEINLNLIAQELANQGLEISVLTSHHPGLKKEGLVGKVKVYRRTKTGANPHSFIQNIKRSLIYPYSLKKEIKRMLKEKEFDFIHFVGTSLIVAPYFKKSWATIESYPALCPKGDRIFKGQKECTRKCTLFSFLSCQARSGEIGKMKNRWYLKYNLLFLIFIYCYYLKLKKGMKHCRLIAISDYVKQLLHLHGKKTEAIIPNALELSKFKNKKKHQNLVPVALYLGSLTKFKGPQIFLKAIKGLNIEGKLYGTGNLQNYLTYLIKKEKIKAKIYPEQVPYSQIPELYNTTDIVVFPSFWPEPFGRISIEAMAAGKPVIGSDIGGIKETIAPGTGLLVKPGKVMELRLAIKKLAEDKKLRLVLGKKGREQSKKYDCSAVAKKFAESYRKYYNPLTRITK